MSNREELLAKLNALVNKYENDIAFGKRINEAPKTIRRLVFSNPSLMKRFGLNPFFDDKGE